MPLNATNFVPLTGAIKAADIKQFFDLFTGVMTDQPVTFANTLQVGGSQGAAAAPVRIGGVAAQTANMIEVRKLAADVQPELSISPTGTLAWGPGGATGTDVTLARSLANQLTLTGLAGTPALIVPVGGITVNGAIDFTGATTVKGVPQQNLLVNPGFEIAQRGTSFNATGQYTADRWQLIVGAGWSGGITALSTAQVDGKSQFSLQFGTSALGSGSPNIQQKVENWAQLAGQTITAQLRVYQGSANGIQLSLNDGVTTTNSATSATTNSWVTLTVTKTLSATPTTLLFIINDLVAGAGAAGTFYLDNATLVVGSVPMDYLPLTPADDLARCLRYYQVIGSSAMVWEGYGPTGQPIYVWVSFLARMGGSPIVTPVGTFTVANCGQPAIYNSYVDGFAWHITVTSTGTYQVQGGTSIAYFTAEWNPLLIPVGLLMMQGAQPDYIVYGLTLIAVGMMRVNPAVAAHYARQLLQLAGLDGLIDRLRSPAAYVVAITRRIVSPVTRGVSEALLAEPLIRRIALSLASVATRAADRIAPIAFGGEGLDRQVALTPPTDLHTVDCTGVERKP